MKCCLQLVVISACAGLKMQSVFCDRLVLNKSLGAEPSLVCGTGILSTWMVHYMCKIGPVRALVAQYIHSYLQCWGLGAWIVPDFFVALRHVCLMWYMYIYVWEVA